MDSEFKQRFNDLEEKVDAVQDHSNSLVGRLDDIDGTLREMRKENEDAHAQIGLNITRSTRRLHDAMDSRFDAVNARFDELEKMVLRVIDVAKGRI